MCAFTSWGFSRSKCIVLEWLNGQQSLIQLKFIRIPWDRRMWVGDALLLSYLCFPRVMFNLPQKRQKLRLTHLCPRRFLRSHDLQKTNPSGILQSDWTFFALHLLILFFLLWGKRTTSKSCQKTFFHSINFFCLIKFFSSNLKAHQETTHDSCWHCNTWAQGVSVIWRTEGWITEGSFVFLWDTFFWWAENSDKILFYLLRSLKENMLRSIVCWGWRSESLSVRARFTTWRTKDK